MDIKDFSQPLTSRLLNENLAKTFGYRVDLNKFSTVQLEDARNKLRTKLSQLELSESFSKISEHHQYQKAKALLDVINQEIFEREMSPEETQHEAGLKSKYDKSNMKTSMKKQYGDKKGKQVYFATIRKRAMNQAVPESWIDSAIERIDLGESSNDELKAELKLRYDVPNDQASWLLCEGEELKAEIIIATKSMVDDVTGWLEDVAAMRAEQFLDLIDSIRAEYGATVAEQYQSVTRPALDNLYSTLEQVRREIDQGLMVISGESGEIIGATPSTTPDAGLAMSALSGAAPVQSEPSNMTPPDNARAKRESVDYSRRLSMILNSKKK